MKTGVLKELCDLQKKYTELFFAQTTGGIVGIDEMCVRLTSGAFLELFDEYDVSDAGNGYKRLTAEFDGVRVTALRRKERG